MRGDTEERTNEEWWPGCQLGVTETILTEECVNLPSYKTETGPAAPGKISQHTAQPAAGDTQEYCKHFLKIIMREKYPLAPLLQQL